MTKFIWLLTSFIFLSGATAGSYLIYRSLDLYPNVKNPPASIAIVKGMIEKGHFRDRDDIPKILCADGYYAKWNEKVLVNNIRALIFFSALALISGCYAGWRAFYEFRRV